MKRRYIYIPYVRLPVLSMYIAAGENTGLIKTGQVWGWGHNNFGQLGDNSTINKCTPVSIQGVKKTFCQIAVGILFTSGLDKYGQVWSWGYNNKGQLGDNSTTSQLTPVSIQGAKKTFCKITGGQHHNIGIDKNGQVWGWGYNYSGLLGDNSTIDKCTPVSIQGVKKTFCNISSGQYNPQVIGIDKYGQVWSWGNNSLGQLGDNSGTDKCTPVSIRGTKKTFCKITAGHLNTIGIDKYGQVWSWGYNWVGGLGDNSTVSKMTPVSIHGDKKTFCNISAGQGSTIGVDKFGQVWGWGYNNKGQLGDNSTTSKLTPVSIQGAKKTFCKITAGENYYTIGIDKNGQVWGWGYNNYGQLGDNTTESKLTPVRVCNF